MFEARYKVFKGITDGNTTRAGLFALLSAKGADFSGFNFWSDLTASFLDAYLNRALRNALLMDDISKGITFDKETKKYSINTDFDANELIYYLMGKFTETEATYNVMTQENLNIVTFNDMDTIVHGKKTTNRDYDKVTVDITNGQKVLVDAFAQDKMTNVFGAFDTDYDYAKLEKTLLYGLDETTLTYGERVTDAEIAQRTNTDTVGEQGDTEDTTTKSVQGFNSASWNNAEKTAVHTAKRTHTLGGGTDTTTAYTYDDTNSRAQHEDTDTTKAHKDTVTEKQHTDTETRDSRTDMHTHQASADKSETAARQDKEEIQTYTDTITRTRHIVLSPDKFFEIQKEMADYNLYKSVLDAVRESVTKGVW